MLVAAKAKVKLIKLPLKENNKATKVAENILNTSIYRWYKLALAETNLEMIIFNLERASEHLEIACAIYTCDVSNTKDINYVRKLGGGLSSSSKESFSRSASTWLDKYAGI